MNTNHRTIKKRRLKDKTGFKNVRDAGKMKSKKSDLSSKKIFEADVSNINSEKRWLLRTFAKDMMKAAKLTPFK